MTKAKKSSFRGKVSSDSKRQSQSGGNYGYLKLPKGVPVYNPTPGEKEKFDILPYTVSSANHPDRDAEIGIAQKGDLWYKRPFRVHRDIGSEKEKVICLSSFGKKCPICEYRAKRAKEGADKDELQAYNSSQRNLYVVVPRGIKKVEEIPHIFDMSQYLFQNLLNEEVEEDDSNEVFPDLEEGLTLEVRWREESFAGNKYAEAGKIRFLERKNAIDDETIEAIPDLDACLKEISYDELSKLFFEMYDVDADDAEDTDEDDDDPKPRKKAIVKKDDDDEDDAPKKPVKKETKKETKKAKWDWQSLSDLNMMELVDLIEDEKLDIDPDDYNNVEELCLAVADELDIKPSKNVAKSVEKPAKKSVVEDDEDDDEDDAPKKPAKKESKPEPKAEKKTAAGKCPHGFKFGIDTDKHDACDDCEVWNACIDQKDAEA